MVEAQHERTGWLGAPAVPLLETTEPVWDHAPLDATCGWTLLVESQVTGRRVDDPTSGGS